MARPDDTPPEHDRATLAEAAARRGDWQDALRLLSGLDDAVGLDGGGLESLGTAAYMLGREPDFVTAYERAFDAHCAAGRPLRAARAAFWIGLTLIFAGESGRGSGWLGKAERLASGHAADCAERGYLLLTRVEQSLAAGNAESANELAIEAAVIGERFADEDLLAIALHLQGRVRLRMGAMAEGLALLDEAMVSVTAGRLSPIVTGLVYCSVIDTCQRYHARQRAREWTEALARWCARQPQVVAFTGRCLIHRAEIMTLNGQWAQAVKEAHSATQRLREGPSEHHAGPAYYQEGEVHRLRGRFDKADDCYRAASSLGYDPQPGLALMRVRQGRSGPALSSIRRSLGAVREPFRRLRLLPAAVEIALAAGAPGDARAFCDELGSLARRFPSEPLDAAAREAEARVALAADRPETALAALGQAAALLRDLREPYPLARVRSLTGQACAALGDRDGAAAEFEAALETLTRLGAEPDRRMTEALARQEKGAAKPVLTRRQTQILHLVAEGLTNRDIARRLNLSDRTVDRHVSDILTRLDVPTRTAATAFALARGLIGEPRSG